jgi:hypothetical protein
MAVHRKRKDSIGTWYFFIEPSLRGGPELGHLTPARDPLKEAPAPTQRMQRPEDYLAGKIAELWRQPDY